MHKILWGNREIFRLSQDGTGVDCTSVFPIIFKKTFFVSEGIEGEIIAHWSDEAQHGHLAANCEIPSIIADFRDKAALIAAAETMAHALTYVLRFETHDEFEQREGLA